MSLGPFPAVSLADAREKLGEVKALLRSGGDPMIERKRSAIARRGVTLGEAVETYWTGRTDVSDGYRSNALRGIERHLSDLLSRPIGGIDRADLLASLQRMDAAGHYVYVRRVRMWVGQVFDWAVEHGHATINPATLIRPEKAFGRARVTSFAALSLREVPEFMARLSAENELNSVLACRLLALTWVRTVELRLMEWSEIDSETWVIPAGKMKRKRDHVVPLSRQALSILDEMRDRTLPEARFVFCAPHRGDRPMSENAILYLIARMGYSGKMTGHGWRSVASTWANEGGYNADAIERQLAHVPGNAVRGIYNRAEYLPIRREMLQAWADWLIPDLPTD
jgi:integrase